MRCGVENALANENPTRRVVSLELLSRHELNHMTVLLNRSEEAKKIYTDHLIPCAMKILQQEISQLARQNTVTLIRHRLQLSRQWTQITKNQTIDNQWKLN